MIRLPLVLVFDLLLPLLVLVDVGRVSAFTVPINNINNINNKDTMSSALSASTVEKSSFLSTVPLGPPDAILGIAEAFRACESPDKVNVCVGAYRDENGQPWVLPSVREAETRLLAQQGSNKEYAPIAGDAGFVDLALRFAYGAAFYEAHAGRVAGVQALSGTGACRVGGAFLAQFLSGGDGSSTPIIYLPDPTWGNHVNIFQAAGLEVRRYRYFDRATNTLDFEGLVEDLREAPGNSVVLLHACAHNPTGCDPTPDQWRRLSDVIQERGLVVFFDSAYQGFASGDAEKDAFALRYFCEQGHQVMLAQSFAKNFGLYGERCGTLSFVCADPDERTAVMSQVKRIVRAMYSSPPIHGSSIVKTVLSDEVLSKQYYEECASMAKRITSMRTLLVQTLKDKGSTHDWSHITDQIGMFAFTGMDKDMCNSITDDFYIFLTKDGRVSLAGINMNNVEYIAGAIHEVTKGKSIRAKY